MGKMNENKRILVVDDTTDNLRALGGLLRELGFRLNVATDGASAIRMAVETGPDLILLDVTMPEMDGFEVCERLKQDERTADIPIIFLSARANPNFVEKGFLVGGVDYITKPFNLVELSSRVQTHLKIRDLTESLSNKVDKLEEAVETISRMSRENESLIRHELANAIQPVIGHTEMMLKESKGNPVCPFRPRLKKILASMLSLKSTIESLSALQSVEFGRTELKLTQVDMVDLVKSQLEAISLGQAESFDIDYRYDVEHAFVTGDRSLLEGMIRNLIKNAVEHVEHLPADQHGLSAVIQDGEHEVAMIFSNGGPSIPQELLSRFFEKFNSTKKEKGGTGLGTSFIRSVVEIHSGSISVMSDSLEGTRISLSIPKRRA